MQEGVYKNYEDKLRLQRKFVKQQENSAPVLKDTIGNYEPIDVRLDRTGPGEYGRPVNLDPAQSEKYEQSYKEYGFNMVISDTISLDRAIPDIRDTQ